MSQFPPDNVPASTTCHLYSYADECEICAYAKVHYCYPPGFKLAHCNECHRSYTRGAQVHCSSCHETFSRDEAELRHWSNRHGVCRTPAEIKRRNGTPMYQDRSTDLGPVWRLADDRPPLSQRPTRGVGSPLTPTDGSNSSRVCVPSGGGASGARAVETSTSC